MALDKAIAAGKEKRKPYRGSARFDPNETRDAIALVKNLGRAARAEERFEAERNVLINGEDLLRGAEQRRSRALHADRCPLTVFYPTDGTEYSVSTRPCALEFGHKGGCN